MLAAGAVVGVAVGLLAQLFLAGVDEEIRGLVRMALLLPGVIFILWWVLSPRPALEQEEREEAADAGRTIDPQARLEKIESTFDTPAGSFLRSTRISEVSLELMPRTRKFSLRVSPMPMSKSSSGSS